MRIVSRIAVLSLVVFFTACTSSGTDITGTTGGDGSIIINDGVDIKAKAWQLYSKDLVYVANKNFAYTSRDLQSDCLSTLNFVTADSLIQSDSCGGNPTIIYLESWHQYSASSYQVEVFTSADDQRFKSVFSLSADTLQLRVSPDAEPDSTSPVTRARILTYRSIPK